MEKGKLDWHETDKLDRFRRSNAQRHAETQQDSIDVISDNPTPVTTQKTMPCKFEASGKCPHLKSHVTKGVYYTHLVDKTLGNNGQKRSGKKPFTKN